MNILIAGIPGRTENYEKALSCCQVSFETSLHPSALTHYDRLLLPGGGDIHPSWYGQTDQGCHTPDPGLDQAQFTLLHAFVRSEKPVLGICRGMQIINVYFGGSLIQDLPTAAQHRWHEKDQIHPAVCSPRSLLSRFYPGACLVNSAHHQGCGAIGEGLTVTQRAEDGVTEAIEHKSGYILGVQWHPERTALLSSCTGIANGHGLIHYFATQM